MERMGSGAAATVTLAAMLDGNVVTGVTFVEHGTLTEEKYHMSHQDLGEIGYTVDQGQKQLLQVTVTIVGAHWIL